MKSSDIFTAIVNEFTTNIPDHKKAAEFSVLSKIDADVVRSYMRGTRNIGNKAKKILVKLGVSPAFLETGQGDILLSNVRSNDVPRNIMRLPVYQNIACGAPATIFQDEPLDYMTLDKIKGLRNPIILKAKGDSNFPDIHEDDLILATEIDRPKKGDLVATNFRKTDPGTLNANIKVYQPTKQKDTFILKPLNSSHDIALHQFQEVYNFYKCIKLIERDLKNF